MYSRGSLILLFENKYAIERIEDMPYQKKNKKNHYKTNKKQAYKIN